MTFNELSYKMHMKKKDINMLTTQLNAKGWISLEQKGKNLIKTVKATESAISLVDRCSAIAFQILDDVTVGMTDLDLLLYNKLQSKIISNLRSVLNLNDAGK